MHLTLKTPHAIVRPASSGEKDLCREKRRCASAQEVNDQSRASNAGPCVQNTSQERKV